MDNLRPKLKLKAVFKSKAIENAQSGRTLEPLTICEVDPTASADDKDAFPNITGGSKRKRVHKAGPRREEHKFLFTHGMASGVPAIHVEEKHSLGYDDTRNRVEDEEDARMANGMNYILDNQSEHLKPEEIRSTEPIQYRQRSLRVKLKPSKFRKISPNSPENQVKTDSTKSNFISTFSALQTQNPGVESRMECRNLDSRPEIHITRLESSASKFSRSKLNTVRSLDESITPRQTTLGRPCELSSSPHQRKAFKSLWISENQQTKAIEKTEGPLKKDIGPFSAARNGERYQFHSNKDELESALTVVKKIMRMDAAEPFNTPVDPVSLGIPDYFDVIDTPMDFGTICHTLEKGEKYKNSRDVFQDVQLIWENCFKYNHKGDPILDLMKRVKKNFTKYWTAADLYYEPPKRSSGVPSSVKADGPSNIEDGRMKEYSMENLASDTSDGNLNDSKTENLNNLGLYIQPSAGRRMKSKATENVEHGNVGNRAKQHNPNSNGLAAVEVQHSSEESESKIAPWPSPQKDAMIKKKGIKFVLKRSMPVVEPPKNTVLEMNEMPDCISIGTDEESGPKTGDFYRSFQEEAEQKDVDVKSKSHRRHRSHHHKPGCLCAVCVALRRKHAREGKIHLATTQSAQTNGNVSEMLNEQPAKVETEQVIYETRGPEEVRSNGQKLNERWKHRQEAVEAQELVERKEGKLGQKEEEDAEKGKLQEPSAMNCPADFQHPLQNTSPAILKMSDVLFTRSTHSAWNQPHSLISRPSIKRSDNPIIAAISSFMN